MNKLLHILPQEEYFSPVNGGAIATWVKDFSNELLGVETIVFAPYSKKHYLSFKTKRARINLIRIMGKILKGKIGHHLVYNTYVVYGALYARLKGFKLIHVHNRPTYIAIIKRLNPSATVMLHMHNDHILGLNSKQLKELNQYCDHIISVSEYIQNGIIRKGLEHNFILKNKCSVLLNGCNPEHFRKQLPTNNNTLLFIGRLTPEKGIKELIQATVIIQKKIPNIKLLIAGSAGFGQMNDSPFVAELKEFATKGKDKIKFLGYIEHHKVPDLFKQVGLYCIPSIWNDPCPLSVIEGMASGIPMIVGNKGGIPEEVGDTALKVNCEDSIELAKTIEYALNNRKEMNLLADKAYDRFINNFTWQHVSENYMQIINNL
ncbi:glycosyltransferase family 4 protein [Saccharicrinis aurantiacus]|uniref:glycosyltransferase family 4 protein n=1 Tax=Saccharicrinis aurantiacus TaxID=1849719 RepID=UPI000950084C|nr:glycosyltransferase family 4 protein [Saccharicrinis aurantiacus]